MNVAAFCSGVTDFTDLVVRQLLPTDALDGLQGALGVLDAKVGPLVVTKVGLADVALQVSLAEVVIDAVVARA